MTHPTDKLAEALRKIAGFALSQFMGPHDMALECVNVARAALAEHEAAAPAPAQPVQLTEAEHGVLKRALLKSVRDAAQAQPAEVRAELAIVEAVGHIKRVDSGDLGIEWLIEGGICALEPGEVLMVSATRLTDNTGSGEVWLDPLHAAQPPELTFALSHPAPAAPAHRLRGWLMTCPGSDGSESYVEIGEEPPEPNPPFVAEALYSLGGREVASAAAPAQGAGPVAAVSVHALSKMFECLDGVDREQPGYHWRRGWNDALRRAMDYSCDICPPPPRCRQRRRCR